jgi:ABC-type Fe3+ transport system substrate-binding protein
MSGSSKITFAGKIVILLFILGCFGGAYYLFTHRSSVMKATRGSGVQPTPKTEGKPVRIGIAYGTEKKRWLEWAVEEFAKAPEGKSIEVDLIPMGSLEGAKAILSGDKRINVWCPASAMYKDVFVQDWQTNHASDPIIRSENLALTPMVFVMWDERYQAFIKKYKVLSFKTISEALKEKGGWDAIAGKPEWGLFKFGHTDPSQSNSGLMTLVLMAYDYHDKCNNLTLKDILSVPFQDWMQQLESGVSGLIHSTGTMMKDMVLRGPSTYDALMVYESVAIDYLKNAEGRWGKLRVVYPTRNAWNDNPYYIINAPWSTEEQRKAANTFLEFLLSEPIQKQSLVHGFRPGNPAVAIKFASSPFVMYEKYGLKINIPSVCNPPKAEVINNLLASWIRNQRVR